MYKKFFCLCIIINFFNKFFRLLHIFLTNYYVLLCLWMINQLKILYLIVKKKLIKF